MGEEPQLGYGPVTERVGDCAADRCGRRVPVRECPCGARAAVPVAAGPARCSTPAGLAVGATADVTAAAATPARTTTRRSGRIRNEDERWRCRGAVGRCAILCDMAAKLWSPDRRPDPPVR